MYRPSRLFTGYPTNHLQSSLAESHPIPQPKPDPALTAGQQLALLKLRRSDLARELVETIERGTTRATGADYDELERRGLAVRKPGSTFRIVSYVGKVRADALARESAKVLGRSRPSSTFQAELKSRRTPRSQRVDRADA